MKSLFVLMLAVGVMALPSSSFAKTSCSDLEDISNSMEKVVKSLAVLSADDIDEETDKALKDVSDGVGMIASGEGNENLTKASNDLKTAYNEKDLQKYSTAAKQLDDLFDSMGKVQCPDW